MKTDRHSPSRKKDTKPLPEPGKKKQDPQQVERLIDKGSEDSMIASDPPSTSQPDVHDEPGRDPSPAQKKPEEKH
jgi:hypothetical protein